MTKRHLKKRSSAGRLAKLIAGALHIKNIISNLKTQPDRLGIPAQPIMLFRAAAAKHRTQQNRSPQQTPGFMLVDIVEHSSIHLHAL